MFNKKLMQIMLSMGLTVALLAGLIPNQASAETMSYIQLVAQDTYFRLDQSQADQGRITIHANREGIPTYKVIVAKQDKQYVYDFSGVEQSYLLQMGDGEYRLALYQSLGKNNYIEIDQWCVSTKIKDEKNIYLISHQLLNWDKQSLAAIQATKITKGMNTDQAKARAIYQYIVDNYAYQYQAAAKLQAGYIPDLEKIMDDQYGICYDFASLYAVMLRSTGIPAKLVMGTTNNVKGYHAWNEVLLNDKWVVVDTSYDIQAKAAKMKVEMIKTSKYSKVKEY